MQDHDFQQGVVRLLVVVRRSAPRDAATQGREVHSCMPLGDVGAGRLGRREVETPSGMKLRRQQKS